MKQSDGTAAVSSQPRRLSEILTETVNELESEVITIAYLTERLGVRAYGALLALLTLPNFIPGIATLTGSFCFLFSIQMALNIQQPWLPTAVRELRIEKSTLQSAINKLLPYLLKFEHYFKPRLVLLNTPVATRLMGGVIAILSLVILIPIPFTNLLPSVALLFMAFGMLQKDGLTTLISAMVGLLFCGLCGWFGFALIKLMLSAL